MQERIAEKKTFLTGREARTLPGRNRKGYREEIESGMNIDWMEEAEALEGPARNRATTFRIINRQRIRRKTVNLLTLKKEEQEKYLVKFLVS